MFNAAKIQAWHDKVKEIMEEWRRDYNALLQKNDAIGLRSDLEERENWEFGVSIRRQLDVVDDMNRRELVRYLLFLTLLGQQFGVNDVKNAIRYITFWNDSFNNDDDPLVSGTNYLFGHSLAEIGKEMDDYGGIPNLADCWIILAGEVYSDPNDCDPAYLEEITALCRKWGNITYDLYKELGAFVIALEGSETEKQILFYNRYIGWLEETFFES